MKLRGLTIFRINELTPHLADEFIESCLNRIYRANLTEAMSLKTLLVLDEVHRLLPKYGGRKAYLKLEQAVREFRKWGIGLLMISQVLTDFKGAIRGNIGTEVQMFSRYEGDIKRVRERHGSIASKLISKLPVGLGMVESGGYNKGNPYFVEFRPIYHSALKLNDKDLKTYSLKKTNIPNIIPAGSPEVSNNSEKIKKYHLESPNPKHERHLKKILKKISREAKKGKKGETIVLHKK